MSSSFITTPGYVRSDDGASYRYLDLFLLSDILCCVLYHVFVGRRNRAIGAGKLVVDASANAYSLDSRELDVSIAGGAALTVYARTDINVL